MKNLFTAILTVALCACFAVPAFAADYTFGSGPDGDTFGKSTGYDELVTGDPLSENVRRDKNAAYNPPPYGIFSGKIPTDQSSLYHNNTPGGVQSGGFSSTQSGGQPPTASASVTVNVPEPSLLPSTSMVSGTAVNTEPRYYADGSIGTLYIKKFNKTIKVYEGESLDNLKIGAGHFASTSAWDGNAAFAGHNRGSSAMFGFVKNLVNGDRITYTTPYGSRTYEVFLKQKISETDYTGLGWFAENIITLITCIEDTPSMRWLVQAREI